jgi:ferredoxin
LWITIFAKETVAAPQVFELRDDDRSYVLMQSPPQDLRTKIQLAVTLCPRQAIRLIED